MNALKHTPGPWTLGEEGLIRSPFGFVGEVAGMDDPDDETKANAALISAAPELLQEARHALNTLAALATGQLAEVRKDSPAILGLRAAIAKAEGRQ